jgi:hypothetical protein
VPNQFLGKVPIPHRTPYIVQLMVSATTPCCKPVKLSLCCCTSLLFDLFPELLLLLQFQLCSEHAYRRHGRPYCRRRVTCPLTGLHFQCTKPPTNSRGKKETSVSSVVEEGQYYQPTSCPSRDRPQPSCTWPVFRTTTRRSYSFGRRLGPRQYRLRWSTCVQGGPAAARSHAVHVAFAYN